MSTKTVQTNNAETAAPAADDAKSRKIAWAVFAVSLLIMAFFLVVDPTWFWLPLPFVLTAFVYAIGYM